MSRPERTAVPREAARQFQAVGQAAAAPQDRGARQAETGAGDHDAAPRATGGGALPAAAVDASQRQPSAALGLLQLQADMRKLRTRDELGYFIANETRQVLRAQQIVVFAASPRPRLRVHTISALAAPDRGSPLLQWFEALLEALQRDAGLDGIREFDAGAYASGFEAVTGGYPLRNLLWVPWTHADREIVGGMLLARATPWVEHDRIVAGYLGGAFAHAWAACGRPSARHFGAMLASWRTAAVLTLLGAALLMVPVPMTALAPVEVAPRDSFVVTTGVDGVVRSVDVEPNAAVAAGQLLLTLNDTVLRNRSEIAERDVSIAEARYKKAAQLAFVDARGRHEMAVAQSELDLKLAERTYARELLARTQIRAERDGIAFFADKKDLIGRPVTVGEKLMEVAGPDASELRIDLAVADAIVLRDGARIKVFLDSDPLRPIEARLTRAAYKAAVRDAQQLSFRLVADTVQAGQKLRLGLRGTAQIYADPVPLGFYLFRRPIAAFRQWSGL